MKSWSLGDIKKKKMMNKRFHSAQNSKQSNTLNIVTSLIQTKGWKRTKSKQRKTCKPT